MKPLYAFLLRRSCALHTAAPWQVHRVQRLGAAPVGAAASELRKRHRRAKYDALRVPRGSAVSSQRPLERSLLRLQRSPLPSTPYICLQSLPPSFSLALFDGQAWTEYQVEGFLKISMATQRCPPAPLRRSRRRLVRYKAMRIMIRLRYNPIRRSVVRYHMRRRKRSQRCGPPRQRPPQPD